MCSFVREQNPVIPCPTLCSEIRKIRMYLGLVERKFFTIRLIPSNSRTDKQSRHSHVARITESANVAARGAGPPLPCGVRVWRRGRACAWASGSTGLKVVAKDEHGPLPLVGALSIVILACRFRVLTDAWSRCVRSGRRCSVCILSHRVSSFGGFYTKAHKTDQHAHTNGAKPTISTHRNGEKTQTPKRHTRRQNSNEIEK